MKKVSKLFATTVVLSLLIAGEGEAQSGPDVFGPNANGPVRVVVVQPDGKILIGGDFTTLSLNGGAAVTRNRMARLNPDGTLDTAFDPKANSAVESIAVQADGNILAGGQFTSIGGQKRNRIARLDAITGAADSFDPNANERVYSIVLQADGKILAGGIFDSIGGQGRRHIARLDAKTGLADAFDPSPDAFGVYAIALQTDGKILAGGSFGKIGGQKRNSIARLDPITGLADSFDPQPIGKGQPFAVFYAITVQADGKILASGDFRSIGGQTRNRIARLDAETGQADSFDPNASGGNSHPDVSTIAVQADGKILAGGAFTNIGGKKRNHIARLDATTGLADSFDPSPDAFGVYTIAVQADGRILAGGQFTNVGGQPHYYFARLDATAAATGSFDPNADSSAAGQGDAAATVAAVALPNVVVDAFVTNFIAQVTTTNIDAKNRLVGFQGDFTFDERVITFQGEPVQKAGITSGNWNVSGNILDGPGPIRILRVTAYSNDFTPLSGSGTLFELRMSMMSKAAQATQLIWAAPPDQFVFIDADRNPQEPGNTAPGSVIPSGRRK